MVSRKTITITISQASFPLLEEAFRRYECFRIREGFKWRLNNLQSRECFTGLGYPSDYESAVTEKLMKPYGEEHPKVMGWYHLTETGARVVKAWHDMGFKCQGFDAPPDLPRTVEVKVEVRKLSDGQKPVGPMPR